MSNTETIVIRDEAGTSGFYIIPAGEFAEGAWIEGWARGFFAGSEECIEAAEEMADMLIRAGDQWPDVGAYEALLGISVLRIEDEEVLGDLLLEMC